MHNILHIILHIINILHVMQHIFCGSFRPFLRLFKLPLLLGSPSHGPAVQAAVDVPPPTTITTNLGFITGSSRKVCWLFSHIQGYCSYRPHWNECKVAQDLSLFTSLVDWHLSHQVEESKTNVVYAKFAKQIYKIWPNFRDHCTPPAQKQRHTHAASSQCWSLY